MNNTVQILVRPMFDFGKAPNTAGEVLTGAFDTGSQDGIFTGIPNRLQQSINFQRAVTGSRQSDFQTIQPYSQPSWRKQNLMNKAQATLNEIHEMAKGSRVQPYEDKADQIAGAKNSSALPPTKKGVLIREQKGPIDNRLRHSLQIPNTKNNLNSVFPGKDKSP